MTVVKIILIYFAAVNAIGLFIMGIDKLKAKRKEWRISEATLFTFALFGGSLGTTLGMFLFHHKTKHWYFLYGMPAILLIQIILAFVLIKYSPISIMIM